MTVLGMDMAGGGRGGEETNDFQTVVRELYGCTQAVLCINLSRTVGILAEI
jgi:hypothetical protein